MAIAVWALSAGKIDTAFAGAIVLVSVICASIPAVIGYLFLLRWRAKFAEFNEYRTMLDNLAE